MKENRKSWSYFLLTVVLIGLGWHWQTGLTLTDAQPFLHGLTGELVVSVALLGFGIFRRRGADALFFDCVGGVCLVLGLVLFFQYGGMEDPTAAGADTAMNLLMCLWTALPLVVWVRTLVLAVGSVAERGRRLLVVLSVVLLLWMLGLFIGGQMLHFVHPAAEALV